MTRPRHDALRAVLLYAGLVVVLTWPLASHITRELPKVHVSSDYDALFLAWSLAHQSRALASAPSTFLDGNAFHPAPHAILYGETGFGMLPYFGPVFLATGNPILALNVAVLVSVTLAAWALHLLTVRWTGSSAAGFVAAWTYLMTRWAIPGGIAGAPNYAVLQYFPAVIGLAAEPALTARGAVWLAVAVVVQGLTSVYVAAAVLAPLVVLAAARLLRRSTRIAGVRMLGVVVVGAVALLGAYHGHELVRRENPNLFEQSFFVGLRQTADLPWGPLSYWTPAAVPAVALLLIAGRVLRRRGPVPRRAWRHAMFWAAAGLVMALPPTARWHGVDVTLPNALFDSLYDVLRVPDRLGVAALFGLSLCTGLAFAEWMAAIGSAVRGRTSLALRGVLAAAVVLGMLVEYLRGPELPVLGRIRTHTYLATVKGFPPNYPVPRDLLIRPHLTPFAYPLFDAGGMLASPLLEALRRPGGAVLEVPVGSGPGGSPLLQARAMFRSTVHWRPLLNGYSRYFPADFPLLMALSRRLPEPDAVAELRRRAGLDMVLVHLDGLVPEAQAPWLAAASSQGGGDLRLVARDSTEMLFAVSDGRR